MGEDAAALFRKLQDPQEVGDSSMGSPDHQNVRTLHALTWKAWGYEISSASKLDPHKSREIGAKHRL